MPKTQADNYDVVGAMMDWESGDMSEEKELELFSRLIKSGLAWSLQGCYGRQAARYIQSGLIDKDGNIKK